MQACVTCLFRAHAHSQASSNVSMGSEYRQFSGWPGCSPAMLPRVRAADRMDVGLARRSVHVDAIRASVSRCHAPAPHCRRRSDRGPGTGTGRCSTQPAGPIIVPRETTATPQLRLPFPAGVGAAASGSLMRLRFKAYLSNCCSSTLGDFGTTRKIVHRSIGPDTKKGRIHGRAAEDT